MPRRARKKFVPDRNVDIFQGRAPRNVLANHYAPQGIKMLKAIYDKASLKVWGMKLFRKS